MPDQKISDLADGSPLQSTDELVVARTGTNVKIPGSYIGDVVGPDSATDDHFAFFDGTTGKLIKDGGAPSITTMTDVSNAAPSDGEVLKYVSGTGEWTPSTDENDGDVIGPASSTDNNLTAFDGITGKLIKDLGPPVTTTLTDVSSTAPTNGQVLKWNTGNSEWEPQDDSTGGDVTGPASSVDNYLVQFDGTTGKLIKELGLPVTTTLTDISNTAPTNGQILKYNSGSGVYEPSNPSAGSIDPFYDAIVATAGADYTTVSAAVAAGHKYILVEATIVSPVIETANVVLTDDVYVFVKGSWQTDDYQIEFSASDTTLRVEGNNTVDSQITVVLSTAVGLLLNTNASTVIMKNIAYNNQSSGGEGSGALNPNQGYLLENVYMSCPNDIACGLDARGSSGNEICVMKDCQVNGGGTSCGAMIIPGQNDLIKNVLITGDFFQFPGDTDSVTNKHAVIWTDTVSPSRAKFENIVINPTTTAITPSFVVSGTCKNWSTDNDISITIYSVDSETLLDGIDFGPAIIGPATGGFLNLWQNSTNVKVVNCKNIGDVTSNTTPNNCTISDTYFSNNMIIDWENLGMSNCYSNSNFTFSGDRLRMSNCRIEGSISVSGTGSILNSNTVGTGSNLSTITLEAGSQSCIATSNVTYSIISDIGTSNTTANNIVA